MTRVTDQYDAYPYPERDPADEARRLITGSPSHPLELTITSLPGRATGHSRFARWWRAAARAMR